MTSNETPAPASLEPLDAIPWCVGFDATVPLDADPAKLETSAAAFHAALDAAGVVTVRSPAQIGSVSAC